MIGAAIRRMGEAGVGFAQEFNCDALIRFLSVNTEQECVDVIRHEHVSRTDEIVACAGMKEEELPVLVK